MPEWSESPPTVAGHYWVWQPADQWPCRGDVHCVLVEAEPQGPHGQDPIVLRAWVPFMDYSDAVDHDDWKGARWNGPIEPPLAPTDQRFEVIPFEEWKANWIGDPPSDGFEREYAKRLPMRIITP